MEKVKQKIKENKVIAVILLLTFLIVIGVCINNRNKAKASIETFYEVSVELDEEEIEEELESEEELGLEEELEIEEELEETESDEIANTTSGSSSNTTSGSSSNTTTGSSSNTTTGSSSNTTTGSSSNTTTGSSSNTTSGSTSNTTSGSTSNTTTGSTSNTTTGSTTEETVVTKYTVAFNSNGGTSYSDQKVEKGKTASNPGTPVKSGYTFEGWMLNGAKFDFSSAITSNITLSASWKEIEVAKTYTVSVGTVDSYSPVRILTVYENGTAITVSNIKYTDGVLLCDGSNASVDASDLIGESKLLVTLKDGTVVTATIN